MILRIVHSNILDFICTFFCFEFKSKFIESKGKNQKITSNLQLENHCTPSTLVKYLYCKKHINKFTIYF